MRNIKIIAFLSIFTLTIGCEQEAELYDFTKYKYVSFVDQEAEIAENYSEEAGKEMGYPIYLQYDGSTLSEDFTVSLLITESGAQSGTDYTVESSTVLFKAESILSEPFYLKTIDNLVTNEEERSLDIIIESVSNPNISIGVGMVNQSNKDFSLSILDNECSETLEIFNSTNLSLVSNEGSATISGTYDSSTSTLLLEGDLVAYGPLANTSLLIDLTPVEQGAKIGTVTFDDYYAGLDTDGWEYTYIQESEGTFDICAGTVNNISFGIYYLSGGDWAYWYSITADISI